MMEQVRSLPEKNFFLTCEKEDEGGGLCHAPMTTITM